MDRFPACLAFTLREEGPPSNDPDDSGGMTVFGRDEDSWLWILSRLPPGIAANLPRDVRRLTQGQAALSYRWGEWEWMRCADLPVGVDLVAFDCAVNPGPNWAPRALQRLVGAEADGIIGPLTLAAVARRPVATLIGDLTTARVRYYDSRPGAWKFDKGWEGRADRCRAAFSCPAGGYWAWNSFDWLPFVYLLSIY